MGQVAPLDEKVILIVEDDAITRFGLVDFFEDEGWRVVETRNAAEAVERLERDPAIRVVLVDVAIPGSMDGLRLAHHVRDRYPPTRLFVTSGVREVPPHELPVRTTFVPKPFDTHRLLRQIEAPV